MSSGTELVGGRIPGERIATTTATADSSTFTTTQTQVMSVTAPLVDGRTYRVRFAGRWASSAAGDDLIGRLREDSTSGTQMQIGQQDISSTSGAGFGPMTLEAEYTAVATGNKTFIVTGVRNGGTGNNRLQAAADAPALLYVEYIRG